MVFNNKQRALMKNLFFIFLLIPLYTFSMMEQREVPPELIRAAENSNDPTAYLRVARKYKKLSDIGEAIRYYKLSVSKGGLPAKVELAAIYINEFRYDKAEHLVKGVVEDEIKDKEVLHLLGELYIQIGSKKGNIEYTKKGINTAFKLIRSELPPKDLELLNQEIKGTPEFLFQLSKSLLILKKDSIGTLILEIAAQKNHAKSQNQLGLFYYNLNSYKEAFYWFQKSAENKSIKAQYNLALMYLKGEGVNQNNKKAFYWFQKSAENKYAQAQLVLGMMYESGLVGVKLDIVKSYYWFQEAKKNGITSDPSQAIRSSESGEVQSGSPPSHKKPPGSKCAAAFF